MTEKRIGQEIDTSTRGKLGGGREEGGGESSEHKRGAAREGKREGRLFKNGMEA